MSGPTTRVRSERDGATAVLTIDNPPVNALGHALRSAIKSALDQALADPAVRAIVLIGAGRTFIAGADITEFGKPRAEPLTPTLIATIEAGAKPVVAAIHGHALGGGLELAMGCHYRIAAADARLGQPEVKLGLIPGAGGTQRLPRLVGVPLALEMIAVGEPIGARRALEVGLVDAIAEGDLRASAVAYAERLVRERAPLRRVRDLPMPAADPGAFGSFRGGIERRRRGVEAPIACIEAVEAAATLPFDEGLARERELFTALVNGEQARAQRYFFFAEREAGKIPDIPAELAPREIRRAAVIGAGTMGGGIAMCFANAGIPVTLVESAREALDRGLAAMRRNYAASASRGGLAADEVERRMALVTGSLAYEDAAAADVVIEAVFEDLPLKQEVFARLDRIVAPDAILATNTSYQDVDAIAAATRRPERVLGMHFFSPANVMRLVEVVRGAATAKPVLATAMALGRKLRKVPVPVGVCYGFVGNRMLTQRSRAVERLLLEGAAPHEIDAALVAFGFPMGPLAASDLAGLDVGWRARKARGTTSPVADALCEAGRFGQKTGAGYYHYEPGSRAPIPDPEVARLIAETAQRLGVARRTVAASEMIDRVLLPMVNEGARILEEGIALRPGDIDVIWVYGYGFPVHRGGPMFYADAMGLASVAARLEEQARRFDDAALAPAPLLARLAAAGGSFADASARPPRG
ncbi:MAG TPA: 3-hydroxyacyl-CoA dehydrogenase NAD-binding domain-containing protein [Stellaceae bacterium]|nr:3-hydroxyacyl-CoA dehydrogenase NAD-binding domain-containing protein [Stellaceae bacterium]